MLGRVEIGGGVSLPLRKGQAPDYIQRSSSLWFCGFVVQAYVASLDGRLWLRGRAWLSGSQAETAQEPKGGAEAHK